MLPHSSLKGRLLRWMLARRHALIASLQGARARADLALVRDTHRRTTLLMQEAASLQVLACVRACAPLGGSMAEAGVFKGGTARLICEAKGAAPLHLFDVFETLQHPAAAAGSARAAEVARHFRTTHGIRAEVEGLLAGYPGVHLHAGVFPATAEGLEAQRFSFVHVDLDLEPSTRDALAYFFPRLLTGGILLGDNYDDPLVHRTIDAFFAARGATVVDLPWGQALVVKTAG